MSEPEHPDLADLYMQDVRRRMLEVRALGEGALRQLAPGDWRRALGPDENSIAVLVQHLSGNMHSRWGNLFGADGEVGSRNRDAEFEDQHLTAEQLWQRWNDGWTLFLGVLERLTPADLRRTLTIRSEVHTVLEAVQRQVAHYSGHVYQIVLLARHWAGENWQTLSIARGQSTEYNRARGVDS
jgi:Protein of unknown function (DUF1572)